MYKRLIEPQNTIALLKERGFGLKKRYGQNFLIDERVLTRIIEGAEITKADDVLEIGPGIGTMTQALCEAAGRVKAVEIDEKLIPILRDTLSPFSNVEVINEDILKVDMAELFPAGFKVVANLPYYITTPIVMRLLESGAKLESMIVMVQKEVAERMRAKPGGKDYGALTLAVDHYAEAELIAVAPPNCFIPRPEVTSAVIRLRRRKEPAVRPRDREFMFALIKAAFSQRRKTLQNALSNDKALRLSKEEIESALHDLGLDSRVRGERLSLDDFSKLSDILKQEGKAF